MTGPRKLFIVGDSFAIPPPSNDTAMTWQRVLADEITKLTGDAVFIVNAALNGSSQDYAWMQLHKLLEGEITDRDYVVVCMTHPGRYWYIEDLPEFSNSNIIDLDRWLTKEQSKAVELYIKHIQRPSLDSLHLIQRLNSLAYSVIKQKLNRPLIVKCFKQELFDTDYSAELNVANGNLFDDIQYWELENAETDEGNSYFKGVDCRYNHMCLSNHKILGERMAQSLVNGAPLDLTTGFVQRLLKADSLDDPEFRKRELHELAYQHSISPKNDYNSRLPWRKRVGV